MVLDIRFKLLTDTAILPTKAHDDDLGIDIYASETVDIKPNSNALIPTGIACQFPVKWVINEWISYGGILKDRSSVSSKRRIYVKAGVIDPSYRGEIKVLMENPNPHTITLGQGDKIAQLILVPSPTTEILQVDELNNTDRGSNGFGSSD